MAARTNRLTGKSRAGRDAAGRPEVSSLLGPRQQALSILDPRAQRRGRSWRRRGSR